MIKAHAQHFVKAIAQVFGSFQIRATLKEWRVAPRYLTIGIVVHDPKQLRKAATLTMEISHQAGVGTGRLEPPIQSLLQGEQLVYQFNLPEYFGVRQKQIRLWKDLLLKDLEKFDPTPQFDKSLIGMGLYQTPTFFGFSNATPHALVAGTSGSGKSELLKTITYQLLANNTPDQLALVIVDPKGDLAEVFENKKHLLCLPASEEDEIAQVLAHVHLEYQRRREHNLRHEKKIVIICDEADDTKVIQPKENHQALLDFVQRGRSLGIHVLIGVHTPDVSSLGAIGKELTNRYLGKASDAATAGHIAGGLDLHKLAGRGDFINVLGQHVQRFQAALITKDDLNQLPMGQPPKLPPPIKPMEVLTLKQAAPAHRPPLTITGEVLAQYVHYGPDTIQRTQADAWGLSRRGHELYKKEARNFLDTYEKLRSLK